jgi:tRNA(Arg) A34 adenosine deaminase TadA
MGRMDAAHASAFTASLPPWLLEELPGLATAPPLATPEQRMDLVNRLADRNWRAGNGGPFAAIVVDAASGALVSVGVNVVLQENLSGVHAEVMALSLAQRRLGRWDLGADGAELELVVNWRPCVMCYGATMWAGVRALAIAGEGAEVEELTGFDEGPMPEDWAGEFERRGIRVSVGVGHEDALEVFRAFGASDAVVYNARGASEQS